jgi:hypothetical protein
MISDVEGFTTSDVTEADFLGHMAKLVPSIKKTKIIIIHQ